LRRSFARNLACLLDRKKACEVLDKILDRETAQKKETSPGYQQSGDKGENNGPVLAAFLFFTTALFLYRRPRGGFFPGGLRPG
jgi:hypothetical protein